VSISQELLELLCCPITKKPMKILDADKIKVVNEAIKTGKIVNAEGQAVSETITEAIISIDNATIYRVDDDIPVMLVGSGIPTDQIPAFHAK